MTSEYQGYRNGHTATLNTSHYRQKTRKARSRPPEQGLSNGLIILVIAIVVGCFAVLWPKYFYPMMFGDPQARYDEEYYNNLIREQQQQQQQNLQAQGSAVQDVSEPAQVVPETGEKTEIVNEERKNNQQLDTTAVKEQSSVLEPKKVEEKKEDKKDVEILLLQTRLDQTEQTLQKLIGQMGALTASLANAGLVVNPDSDDTGEAEAVDSDGEDDHNDNDHHESEESDSDDETEESEEDVSESE